MLLAGAFTRGAFCCGHLRLDATGFLLAFDGQVAHHTEEFEGDRVAFVFHAMEEYFIEAQKWAAPLQAQVFPVPATSRATMQQCPPKVFKFLYLLAGPERRCSVANCMKRLALAYGYEDIQSTEIDIL